MSKIPADATIPREKLTQYLLGESIAVVTVPISAVAPLRADQVPSVRSLAEAA